MVGWWVGGWCMVAVLFQPIGKNTNEISADSEADVFTEKPSQFCKPQDAHCKAVYVTSFCLVSPLRLAAFHAARK